MAKNATYRWEWALTQTSSQIYNMAVRIYDTDDATLLYPYGDGNTKMVDQSAVVLNTYTGHITGDPDVLGGLRLGNNGWTCFFTADCYDYYGGLCVRNDDWCGAYSVANG